jgi:hypothetical protein
MVFNSTRNLIFRAILASSSSLCLSSYSKSSLASVMVPATDRNVWCVVGNRFLIANSKTKPIRLYSEPLIYGAAYGEPLI